MRISPSLSLIYTTVAKFNKMHCWRPVSLFKFVWFSQAWLHSFRGGQSLITFIDSNHTGVPPSPQYPPPPSPGWTQSGRRRCRCSVKTSWLWAPRSPCPASCSPFPCSCSSRCSCLRCCSLPDLPHCSLPPLLWLHLKSHCQQVNLHWLSDNNNRFDIKFDRMMQSKVSGMTSHS